MLRSRLGGVGRKAGPFLMARIRRISSSDLSVLAGVLLIATGLWQIYEPAMPIWLGLAALVAGLLGAVGERTRGR